MKVEKIFDSPSDCLIYMERYVNNGSPSGFDKVHTTSITTSPVKGEDEFDLLVLKFDETIKVEDIGDIPSLNKNCTYCHPDNIQNEILQNIKEHWKIVDKIKVSPTASGRTVKVIGKNLFIKLDYMGMLGRINRNLDYIHLLSACEVTRDIKEGISLKKYNSKFGVLPEDSGRVVYIPLSDGTYYEMGFILRDSIPFSNYSCNQKLFLIPCFSLFGKDLNDPLEDTIILQLLKKSKKNVNDFAFEDVFKPIIDCYFDTLINHGLALEAHAQNMLFAIDSDYNIALVVARDMESVDKDLPLREYLKVPSQIQSLNYKSLKSSDYNYTIKHSFMFDFKLGKYLLDPLILEFNKIPEFDEENLLSKITKLSQSYITKLPDKYFPKTWYDYENIVFKSGEKRPYKEHENPRYR